MDRRVFLKGLSLATILALFPKWTYATNIDVSQATFDSTIYTNNKAQTIMIYLYGGASELGGNLSNLDEIQTKSQNKYDLGRVTKTANNFWSQAGGESMERMLTSGDMKIFRTCYSTDDSRSHEICTARNQRGMLDTEGSGIFSTLGTVLTNNGIINVNTILPFLTMEGDSGFFANGNLDVAKFLKPSAINESLSNPYARPLSYQLYTKSEWEASNRTTISTISNEFDAMAKSINGNSPIQTAFEKRGQLDTFIASQNAKTIPESIVYPNTSFGNKLKTAMKVLINNSDTKVISLGSAGLGGWDDHANAVSVYTDRMTQLMSAIEVAMAHMKAENRDNISIMVFAEFGRNVNLNDSFGWDHGNNQNLYIFGGKKYFNSVGIVGETMLEPTGSNNRLYTMPKTGTYWFEPYSIGATIYRMYGITNPEVLTGGFGAINVIDANKKLFKV
ncbi:MAG: DUF1501 domain-containing protein [Sulfurovum sp.]|nr:MAG: DUF1501 domain-containing protein [Sulfurovum sp.]